jgi:hypothetical protein
MFNLKVNKISKRSMGTVPSPWFELVNKLNTLLKQKFAIEKISTKITQIPELF